MERQRSDDKTLNGAMPTYRYDPTALRRLLAERGLSVSAVARRAGVERHMLYHHTRGRGRAGPWASSLAKLATALGVKPGAFFTNEEPP